MNPYNMEGHIMKNEDRETLFINFFRSSENIMGIYLSAGKYRNDPIMGKMLFHYAVIELHIFIGALSKIVDSATPSQEEDLRYIEPLIHKLKNCGNEVRTYRNNRVAHLDNLDKPIPKHSKMQYIPMSLDRAEDMYVDIRVLITFISMVYIDEIRKIGGEFNPKKEEITNVMKLLSTDNRISKIKIQDGAHIDLSSILNSKQYRYWRTKLDSVGPASPILRHHRSSSRLRMIKKIYTWLKHGFVKKS